MPKSVVVLGIFVADVSFRTPRLPVMGETLMGRSFALGPGGKGSNQAVASARAGAETRMLTCLGDDTFADLARRIWAEAGVTPEIRTVAESYTGSACILVEDATGNNAIIVAAGAAATMTAADIENWEGLIAEAGVFLTQLEHPLPLAHQALALARKAGVTTILNPAPSTDLPDGLLALCDFVTPNESEAEGLTGIPVTDLDSAEAAGTALRKQGAGTAILTLGEKGVLICADSGIRHIPVLAGITARDTTGAGDAFNGAFAASLSRGASTEEAARFGVAAAGISVTRPGAAASMAARSEIDALLARA